MPPLEKLYIVLQIGFRIQKGREINSGLRWLIPETSYSAGRGALHRACERPDQLQS
jgi:hypothetical protein